MSVQMVSWPPLSWTQHLLSAAFGRLHRAARWTRGAEEVCLNYLTRRLGTVSQERLACHSRAGWCMEGNPDTGKNPSRGTMKGSAFSMTMVSPRVCKPQSPWAWRQTVILNILDHLNTRWMWRVWKCHKPDRFLPWWWEGNCEGTVHWFATSHLNSLPWCLNRESFPGARVRPLSVYETKAIGVSVIWDYIPVAAVKQWELVGLYGDLLFHII